MEQLLTEAMPMSIHKIYFDAEMKKIYFLNISFFWFNEI